jgi:hypothetical protein
MTGDVKKLASERNLSEVASTYRGWLYISCKAYCINLLALSFYLTLLLFTISLNRYH